MIAISIEEEYLRKYIRYYHRAGKKRQIRLHSKDVVRQLMKVLPKVRHDSRIDNLILYEDTCAHLVMIQDSSTLENFYRELFRQSFRSYMAGATLANPDSSVTELIRIWLDEFEEGDNSSLVSSMTKDWQRVKQRFFY